MLVCLSLNSNPHEKGDAFTYELSTVPAALFDASSQCMRKADKAVLGRYLCELCKDASNVPLDNTIYVLDGGALVHKMPWPKCGTFKDVFCQYATHVLKHYGKATIVFDGYSICSTKDVEHKRRNKQSSLTFAFYDNTPIVSNKTAFLCNSENKQRSVNALGTCLKNYGSTVIHSTGDSDTLIVKTALCLATEKHVTVVADDTDILLLLLYRDQGNMALQSSTASENVIDIKLMQDAIGKRVCGNLLFVHVFTICDTTSALYGKGKKVYFNILENVMLCQLVQPCMVVTKMPPKTVS